MNLLNRCELWMDRNEIWKVIQTIEEMPQDQRTPALVSMLGWAYCRLAEGDHRLYDKALRLLLSVKEPLKDDYRWNFRMAMVYTALDFDNQAGMHARKALRIRRGDNAARLVLENAERRMVCPLYQRTFRKRVKEAWNDFTANECALRDAIDRAETKEGTAEGLALGRRIFYPVIRGVSFALGKREDTYVLTLSPDGSIITLYKILYFLKAMPQELRDRWIVRAGRGADPRILSGATAGDVTVTWKAADDGYTFRLCSPELTEKNPEEEKKAAQILLRGALGELNLLALSARGEVVPEREEQGVPLASLGAALAAEGVKMVSDGEEALRRRARAYGGYPIRDTHSDWRLDVKQGYSECMEPVEGYLASEDRPVDLFHQDGVAAAFFICRREDTPDTYQSAKEIAAALKAYIEERGLTDTVTFTGWADGLYSFYIDVLSWAPADFLKGAEDFFRKKGFRQCGYHTFRRHIPTMYLLKENPSPKPPKRAPRPILTEDFVTHLEGYMGETEGYFEAMLHDLEAYLTEGAATGRFTQEEAREDLDTALWYAYACLNMGTYETYWKAAQWMPASEPRAAGCGKWYYRYAVALMNCGRLEEARTYAEKGVQEEPDYPWIWLVAGKLRSHFGDREGALEAVGRGLFLEPDNYEFQTLRKEILRGATLEEMEYHWIDPESDRNLLEGLDDDTDEKRRALACITTDEGALQTIFELFQTPGMDTSGPYCILHYPVCGHMVDVVFLMNTAGLSKLNLEWIRKWKKDLDSGVWLTRENGEDEGLLEAVFVGLDYTVMLRYIPSRGDVYFDVPPAPARRRTAEASLEETAVLFRDQACSTEAFAAALEQEGLSAENVGDDTVIAVDGDLTAVLCFYNQTKERPGLPAHKAYVTAAVIGEETNREARQALLDKVLRTCTVQPGAIAVLI